MKQPGTDPVQSFAAVSAAHANTLVLGSMPGKRSLQAQRYYAHPRNSFWLIMARLLNADISHPAQTEKDYQQALTLLTQRGIALWDVLHLCERATSLDADIIEDSVVANNFSDFFDRHPEVNRVFFNGAKAQQLFQRHVLPELGSAAESLTMVKLPSTSPAHAALNFEQKLQAWRVLVDG